MFPSDASTQRTRRRSRTRVSCASSGDARSGSVTISMSGVPARFRSTSVAADGTSSHGTSCMDFPASSSRWMRFRRISRRPAGVSTATEPPVASGRSYWEIW